MWGGKLDLHCCLLNRQCLLNTGLTVLDNCQSVLVYRLLIAWQIIEKKNFAINRKTAQKNFKKIISFLVLLGQEACWGNSKSAFQRDSWNSHCCVCTWWLPGQRDNLWHQMGGPQYRQEENMQLHKDCIINLWVRFWWVLWTCLKTGKWYFVMGVIRGGGARGVLCSETQSYSHPINSWPTPLIVGHPVNSWPPH